MLTTFPTPVLFIAADAVRDLEGSDALSGLWTLFTKCKDSLQDGRRLENISWRLWYREMMRDDFMNRLHQEKKTEKEQQQQDSLGLQQIHTPTNLHHPPTPSESMPSPPYAVQGSSPATRLPHDRDSATTCSFSFGLTQDSTSHSISPADSAPTSLQMTKSDTLDVPVDQFSLSGSSSSPCGFADITPHYVRLACQAPTERHIGSSVPVCVGRIIYDMLPCSPSNGSGGWVKELRIGLRWAGPSSLTTATTGTLTAMPTPVTDPSRFLQPPASRPTIRAEYSSSTELTSTTMNAGTSPIISSTTITTTIPSTPSSTTPNTRYTCLPSPSLSDSYARAHPGEVELLDTMHLEVDVGLGPSLSVSASSPPAPQMFGHAHIFGLSPTLQVPPRVVVVNPTPNLTPHPTPPASPLLSASTFVSTSSVSVCNRSGRIDPWQQTDRSRSENLDLVPSIISTGVNASTAANIKNISPDSVLFVSPPPPQPPPFIVQHYPSADEGQLLASPELAVQDLGISAKTKSNLNKHSISSTMAIAANSLKSSMSTLSPPLTVHQSTSSTNQKQSVIAAPAPHPIARRASSGRSSSASASRNGRGSAIVADRKRTTNSISRSRSRENREIGRALLVMTSATSGEKKKPVITISTKPKQRSKFMLGRSGPKGGGGNSGKLVGGGGSGNIRREGSEAEPGGNGAGAVENNKREREKGPNSKSGSDISGAVIRHGSDPIAQSEGKERDNGDGGIREEDGQQENSFPQTQHQQDTAALHPAPPYQHYSNPASSNSEADINPLQPPARTINTKHSTHETLNLVSSALAAKVRHTLSDPLLPGLHKRTIVLTSESDFEDSDDDGSWSSEEMGSDNDEEKQQEQLLQHYQRQQQLQRQLQHQHLQQQQLRQLQQRRPPPVQRTHSSNHHPPSANHHPNYNYSHTRATTRAQRTSSSRGHRNAAHEPEMFVKKPTESFQNLTQVARTRSAGLLTQLMNPSPEIFPVGHPYRRGYSSSEIRGVDGGGNASGRDRGGREVKPLPPLKDVKATKTDNGQDDKPDPRPEDTHRKLSAGGGHSRAAAALSPPARTLSIQMTKSTAAMPVSSQVQVGSVSAYTAGGGGHDVFNGFGMTNLKMTVSNGHSSGGYRLKGPPQDQELEDESGSEAEFGGGIQVSKSVAQEKLKALAQRRGIVTHENQATATTNADGTATSDFNQRKQLGDEDDVPHWAKVSQPRQPTRRHSQDQAQRSQALNHNANRRSLNGLHFSQMNASTSNHPHLIPVGHPYNLPPPAPPSTPRTTRRLMLSTELPESLRRNLLWERQVSKVNLAAAVRRTASMGGSRHSVLGGIQPLTTAPNMVQLHPKGTIPDPGSPVRVKQEGSMSGDGVKERRASGGAMGTGARPAVYDEEEREKRKQLAMARNRSWVNDYHYSGW